jgi:hypothetical protein
MYLRLYTSSIDAELINLKNNNAKSYGRRKATSRRSNLRENGPS